MGSGTVAHDTVTAVVSRRSFIAGSAGLGLAACSGSGGGSPDAAQVLVSFFADGNQGPGQQRLAFGIADSSGKIVTTGPEKLTGRIVDVNGKVVVASVVAPRRGVGLPRPYWAFEMQLAEPGTYTLEVGKATAAFTVSDPARLAIPRVGQPLPAIDTPTIADPRGVNPICTANPICPLHSITLAEALALGKPVALLVGTPAHCKTAVCGPVLTFLIEDQVRLAGKVTVVHAEVYKDDTINDITDTMLALKLKYEPVLFLTDASGTIVTRLDNVWDATEQRAALAKVAG